MNTFILENIFIKLYIYHFSIHFYKNKKLKSYFGDHIFAENNFIFSMNGVFFFSRVQNDYQETKEDKLVKPVWRVFIFFRK